MLGKRVVVIGAGVGGLVSAALLATRGLDVTVVEAATTPGGKLRAVNVDDQRIDGGPTVFTKRDVFEQVFADCGESLGDHLQTRPAHILARHAWGDTRLDLFADPQASEDAIGDFAGVAEARGYRRFRAEAKRLHDALDAPFMQRGQTDPIRLGWRMGTGGFRDYCSLRPYTSMWGALGGYFADPRLRQLFGRYATYCGSSPFAAPATLMLIAHVEASGVWLIEGGMHRLATALEGLAKRRGARFRYDAPVREIMVERGRAAGVVLASGERIAADRIICNADPAAIADGAFGAATSRAVRGVAPRRRSLSAMVWTANARATGFPLARHNVVFSDDYPAEFAALAAGRLPDRPSIYLCAQDRDDVGDIRPSPLGEGLGWGLSTGFTLGETPSPPPTPPLKWRGEEARERVQIIVNAPPTGDRQTFTPAEIDTCRQRMLDGLSRAGLSLDLGDGAVLTTPAGFEALCPRTGGALYGPASHGWAASFLRQGSRTRIPGLYCAGGSTHPGAGVPMAALSARQAVDCLLRDQGSTSRSVRTATPGGISTRPARTALTG